MLLGPWRVHTRRSASFGVIITGVDDAPADYVNEALLIGEARAAFLSLIDHEGLVVCLNVGGGDHLHRDVRGRSSKGRLSQGEYYHHDGCSGPVKPRVVEIRCPYQATSRHIATAIAPFEAVVPAMIACLPRRMRDELGPLSQPPSILQGKMNRMLRRRLPAETQRAYFREVDALAGAYREPWQMGESRFIANNCARTMQHRRAYLREVDDQANGKLMKRWPDGPDEEAAVCEYMPAEMTIS